MEVSCELHTARHTVDFKASSSESAHEAWPECLQFGAPWPALGAPAPSAQPPRR